MVFDVSKLRFSFDLNDCDYQIDALQNKLLQFYLRADRKFRQAFYQNYTSDFLQFIKDKTRLNEPVRLSVMGMTRSGKSYASISLCIFHQAQYNNLFSSEYVCGNIFEFLEKLKTFSEKDLFNKIFLVDEEKQTIFGVGSTAKKLKITDVQNIIAKNNISTIMLNPTRWADPEGSSYGLRTFGRCFNTKTVRFMLYNLQEKGRGGELPMGNVYLPIFTEFLPKEESDKLEKDYIKKKDKWIAQEMRGEGDVLEEMKRKTAESFVRDPKYLELKSKRDRINYISLKMGSEWTSGEIQTIEGYTKLISEGIV